MDEITEELVPQADILEYAKKNTSPKMPIEQKFVFSFLNSLLNSTSVKLFYRELSEEMQGGESFVMYKSLYEFADTVDSSLRHIVTYSMLKKDMRMFELISQELFTGSVTEYHGIDLAGAAVETTDEHPLRYTDESITTDMMQGLVIVGFKNYYCNDQLPGEERYQTIEELEKATNVFDTLITLTKPARVEILAFNVPWCYLSGDASNIIACGIDTSMYPTYELPFGDTESMAIIDNYSDYELINSYRTGTMWKVVNDIQIDYIIELTRKVTKEPDAIVFDYDIKYHYEEEDRTQPVWNIIEIEANEAGYNYVRVRSYKPNEPYFEKYVPIMLRINDNDPDGPCLAFEIDNGTPRTGAMFYTREKATVH